MPAEAWYIFKELLWRLCLAERAETGSDCMPELLHNVRIRQPIERLACNAWATCARPNPPTSLERRASGTKQNVHSAIQSSSLNHQPSAVSHQPSAISLQPSASSQQPAASSQQSAASNHQPSATSHQPSAFSLQPSFLNPQPFAFLFS